MTRLRFNRTLSRRKLKPSTVRLPSSLLEVPMQKESPGGKILAFRQPLFLVTLTYTDSHKFGRVFDGFAKAEKFAAIREKSRLVASVRIKQLDSALCKGGQT